MKQKLKILSYDQIKFADCLFPVTYFCKIIKFDYKSQPSFLHFTIFHVSYIKKLIKYGKPERKNCKKDSQFL